MKYATLTLLTLLGGCSFVTGNRLPDGTVHITTMRLFTDVEIGKLQATDGKGATFDLEGSKAAVNQQAALDLLNTAARLARPTTLP